MDGKLRVGDRIISVSINVSCQYVLIHHLGKCLHIISVNVHVSYL